MEKINVGIIGFGTSASVFHAPILDYLPEFEIKKVYERKSEKSKKEYPYVEVVHNIEDLFAPDIDAVLVTTPNKIHYDHAKLALLHNKHVIVEKPFTVSSTEAKELVDLAIKKNLALTVNQNRRWDGDFLTVKKLLKSKKLGKIVNFEAHFDRFRNFIKDKWKEKDEPGSGIVYDLGSHLIDQALCIFGEPYAIFADIRKQRPNAVVDDYFEIILDYNTIKVTLKADMLSNYKSPKYIIKGLNGTFIKYGTDVQEDQLKEKITPDNPNYGKDTESNWGIINYIENEQDKSEKIETETGRYHSFYKNFYDRVTNNNQLEVRPETALRTIQIIEKAFESNKERKFIIL
ncbi:MAG: Gfo/Idh/MocA family oxidoreductase [Thermotogota bacterium]